MSLIPLAPPTLQFVGRTVALALILACAVPAKAQRASDVPGRPAPVALSETPGAPLSLQSLFNAETLDFSQSFEASYVGGAGGAAGLGLYTASLRWQPSSKLAGRVDLGVARNLFGDDAARSALGLGGPDDTRVFLRNAELAYRPSENATIHLSVQQSPYGAYASPYGVGPYGSRYGAGPGYGLGYGVRQQSATLSIGGGDSLFFRDGR